jgi:hypothetical protein
VVAMHIGHASAAMSHPSHRHRCRHGKYALRESVKITMHTSEGSRRIWKWQERGVAMLHGIDGH